MIYFVYLNAFIYKVSQLTTMIDTDDIEIYSNPYNPHNSGMNKKRLKYDLLELAERR